MAPHLVEPGARILIDGTMARGGGGYTYLVNILHRLADHAPQAKFLTLIRSMRLAQELPARDNLEVRLLPPVGPAGRLRFVLGEAARIAADWRADLYFSAGEAAPPNAHCPTIASFRNPNIFPPPERYSDSAPGTEWPLRDRLRFALLRNISRLSALTCDRIMFVSEDSARWIGETAGLPAERREVVHHGIDGDIWRRAGSEPRPHDRPYILSVSSIYRYKNFVRLIEAYRQLVARRPELPDLVLIGDDQDPAYSARMREARRAAGPLAERIHILGEVPYSRIPAWYAGAELFVFPSYLETFGHPLLEAMAARAPVVAADIPVFREIGRDAALYADPFRSESLADAMEEVLFGFDTHRQLVKRGDEVVRDFSWDRTSARLLGMFHAVLAEKVSAGLCWRTLVPTVLLR